MISIARLRVVCIGVYLCERGGGVDGLDELLIWADGVAAPKAYICAHIRHKAAMQEGVKKARFAGIRM